MLDFKDSMFKQTKQQDAPAPRRRKVLAPIMAFPTMDDVSLQLAEAQAARGVMLEVQIKNKV